MSQLADLEPSLVWQHFDRILQVPRPSGGEQKIRAEMESWAAERGFEWLQDAYGNAVVRVPATPGHEKAPAVVLQGHLDMVGEQELGVGHDFDRDPIRVEVDGDWLRARGTTLGADNGIGVAAALAIADDDSSVHGPLEILLTVEEETGLIGAGHFDGSLLQGRILLNLDSEDPAFYVGCAGAAGTIGRFSLRRGKTAGEAGQVVVSGLRGGHSGMAILGNPANSNQLLARTLRALLDAGVRFGLVDFNGGNSRNAIPRDAAATLQVEAGQAETVRQVIARQQALYQEEYAGSETALRVDWKAGGKGGAAWEPADAERLIDGLLALPHGVLAMSRSIPNLVETSNNLGIVQTQGDEVVVTTLTRSSSNPALEARCGQIAAALRLAGARVEPQGGYPGWQPNLDSPLLRTASEVHARLFGHPPAVEAVHAGLECGVLGAKVPGLDMLSFGPTIEGAHTPKERIAIDTVAPFYRLLKDLLAELAK